jgi:hypothetical protein
MGDVSSFLVRAVYGIGGACEANLDSLQGMSVRQLLKHVSGQPQDEGPAARTAEMLAGVLGSGRELDVELVDGVGDASGRGEPIALDDEIRFDSRNREETRNVNVRVSEHYRGGSV